MKTFYTILTAIAFLAITFNVSGQSQENELSGVSTKESSLKSSTVYDLIRLKIENPYVYDATVIYYYETFSDDKGQEDSNKMFNTSEKVPEIFTRIGNAAMAINGFSELAGRVHIQVPVSVRNRVWDECEISADLDDFTDEYDVVLEDKEKSRYINLRKVSYVYSPTVLGTEHERFVMHLTKSSKVATGIFDDEEKIEKGVFFTSDHNRLNVNIDARLLAGPGPEAGIEVFSRDGRQLMRTRAKSGITPIELAGGQIYIVRVNMGNQSITKKVAVR